MFFTNNIAKSINKNLNSQFKNKYPLFEEWKNSILNVADNFFEKKVE